LYAHGLFPRWFIFMMAAELAAQSSYHDNNEIKD
jgi:hypothetical protein